MKYRKKPVVVEAVQFTGTNVAEVEAFTGGKAERKMLAGPGRGMHEGLVIHTLEGDMRVTEGGWVIRGVQGEFYPCKPGIFEATYEIVED